MDRQSSDKEPSYKFCLRHWRNCKQLCVDTHTRTDTHTCARMHTVPSARAVDRLVQWATMVRYQYVYLIFIRTLKQITAGIISKIRKLKANNIEQRYSEAHWGVAAGSIQQAAGGHKKILEQQQQSRAEQARRIASTSASESSANF